MSQTKFTPEKDIVGRWIEIKRIVGDSIQNFTEHQDTYVFRSNQIFHKGEAAEGVIIFNITGKYSVKGDTISIIYKDYLNRMSSRQKAKETTFKVLSYDKVTNELLVEAKDYDFEYQMLLKKQHSE